LERSPSLYTSAGSGEHCKLPSSAGRFGSKVAAVPVNPDGLVLDHPCLTGPGQIDIFDRLNQNILARICANAQLSYSYGGASRAFDCSSNLLSILSSI